MSGTADRLLEAIRERETVRCPHCEAVVDMTDSDRYPGHVTYWGERDPVREDCGECGGTFFLKEHVTRYWTAGKTIVEAAS